MAFASRSFTPFSRTFSVCCRGAQWMKTQSAASVACRFSSLYSNSSNRLECNWMQKRFFSETPHEFFPRVLMNYKPSSPQLSKDQLIAEMKTAKVSFERGKVILADLLYLKQPFTTEEMEIIIQANMKMKNYIRVVSFADYCFHNKLMPEITETTADYILFSCAELQDGSILKYINHYLPNYIQEKYAFKSKLLRSYYTCHMKEEGDKLMALFEKDHFRFSDCNNNILDGLYEGGYYQECILTYKKIETVMNEASKENPIKLYHRGYFAVLKAYCKLGDETNAIHFIEVIKQQSLYLNDDCYYCLCEMYDQSEQWKNLSHRVFDVFAKKDIPVSDVQKQIITARAKEVQYVKGMNYMNDYCKTHGSLLNIDKKDNRLVLQCQNLPASACRMRVLKLFYDINKTYRYEDYENLTISIRAMQEQSSIIKLLENDLVPSIRYEANGMTLVLNKYDILKWLDRKSFNFEYFK